MADMSPIEIGREHEITSEFMRCWPWLEAGLIPNAYMHEGEVWRFDCSSSPLPPSPPAEKATGRQDQARQASTGDGAGDGG
jgi:hypothetical protein